MAPKPGEHWTAKCLVSDDRIHVMPLRNDVTRVVLDIPRVSIARVEVHARRVRTPNDAKDRDDGYMNVVLANNQVLGMIRALIGCLPEDNRVLTSALRGVAVLIERGETPLLDASE